MGRKKIVRGTRKTASTTVRTGDLTKLKNSQIAIGEHLNQTNMIFNVYGSLLQQGKTDGIPEKTLAELNAHLSQIKTAESDGIELSTNAYYWLGLSAYWERDFDTAVSYLIKALEKDSTNISARNLLGTIYVYKSNQNRVKNRHEDVFNDCGKVILYLQNQSNSESLMLMGYAYKNMFWSSGRKEYLDKSREEFENVLVSEDSKTAGATRARVSALDGLGDYHACIGNYDMAINMYLEAIRLYPQYASAHRGLASVYEAKMGESGASIDEWRLKAIDEWRKYVFFSRDDPAYTDDMIANIEKRIQRLEQM